MKKIKLLFGAGLIASFDLAFGIFIVILVGKIMHVQIVLWKILFGMFLSVLPDMDMAIDVLLNRICSLFGKKWKRIHRKSILHRPIPMLVIVPLMMNFFLLFWAIISFLLLLCHFFHDATEYGSGITLFWPFSKKRYLIVIEGGRLRLKKLEQKELERIFAIKEEVWIEKYLCWRLRPIIHAIAFVTAAVMAIWIIIK
jgi:hypothetical protein